jgi:superfamily II DNA helicase RecQ
MQTKAACEKGLNAIAVNEDTHKTKDLWKTLATKVQLAYISPEMARSPSFRKLRDQSKFQSCIAAVAVDEAHTVREWSTDDFRPQFKELGELRGYLGYEIPVIAGIATCQTETFEALWTTLKFGNRPFWGVDVGTDRANLLYLMRAQENTRYPILDVLYVLPASITAETPAENIPIL